MSIVSETLKDVIHPFVGSTETTFNNLHLFRYFFSLLFDSDLFIKYFSL